MAHVLMVAAVALEYGGTEEHAIAAMLHDVLEDGGPQHAVHAVIYAQQARPRSVQERSRSAPRIGREDPAAIRSGRRGARERALRARARPARTGGMDPRRAGSGATAGAINGDAHIERFGAPSSTRCSSAGRSPRFQRRARCATRYRSGPPSGAALRAIGRSMQTNSVSSASAVTLTVA